MQRRQDDATPIEMWGGIECTVNRVDDRYFDQLERNGHSWRISDLDLFADLGIRAIRYPILWERTAPNGLARADWSWPDERLDRLRALGLRPIVGLVHHGSGPRDTNLLDASFPERLAAYAGAVARRYPWIDDYTPVNEPLTTARFSALYGHWYPHVADDSGFARALIGQCRAVVLAMSAIREVNPAARLIQTDDLGKTYGISELSYQVQFENERRWISFDLLTGRLTPDRPMWHWLVWAGISEGELTWFLENPCPPDIIGINHYLSSERFLDERVERYPGEPSGSNGQHTYADVLAARVLPEGAAGPHRLVMEAWDRFHLPVAVTEVHNGSTREEQLRWLDEVWQGATTARLAGADIRAVTVWSFLGAYDWHRMVTRDEGHYESGVFDLRAPEPRPTAIARMVRDLALTGRHDHPVLATPGWWRRPDRFIYGQAPADTSSAGGQFEGEDTPRAAPILLIGSGGHLSRALVGACAARGLPLRAIDRRVVDLTDPATIDRLFIDRAPWAVIDLSARDEAAAGSFQMTGLLRAMRATSAQLAARCAERDLQLLIFSSDRVFGGDRAEAHGEDDPLYPADAIGRWQADLEAQVRAAHPSTLIVRTGPLFGGTSTVDAIATAIGEARDEVVSPTYIPDLVQVVLDHLIDGETGIWHLANGGATTRDAFAHKAAALAGFAPTLGDENDASTDGRAGISSRALTSTRGWFLPRWDDALARWVASIEAPEMRHSGAGHPDQSATPDAEHDPIPVQPARSAAA